jgi:glutamine cyclotransferase
LIHEGDFFESTGLYGESSLRRVLIDTGEVVQRIELDDADFGEGLARVGQRLIQLTWESEVA